MLFSDDRRWCLNATAHSLQTCQLCISRRLGCCSNRCLEFCCSPCLSSRLSRTNRHWTSSRAFKSLLVNLSRRTKKGGWGWGLTIVSYRVQFDHLVLKWGSFLRFHNLRHYYNFTIAFLISFRLFHLKNKTELRIEMQLNNEILLKDYQDLLRRIYGSLVMFNRSPIRTLWTNGRRLKLLLSCQQFRF